MKMMLIRIECPSPDGSDYPFVLAFRTKDRADSRFPASNLQNLLWCFLHDGLKENPGAFEKPPRPLGTPLKGGE